MQGLQQLSGLQKTMLTTGVPANALALGSPAIPGVKFPAVINDLSLPNFGSDFGSDWPKKIRIGSDFRKFKNFGSDRIG